MGRILLQYCVSGKASFFFGGAAEFPAETCFVFTLPLLPPATQTSFNNIYIRRHFMITHLHYLGLLKQSNFYLEAAHSNFYLEAAHSNFYLEATKSKAKSKAKAKQQ